MTYGSGFSTFQLEGSASLPVAIVQPNNIAAQLGSIVLLDASASYDPDSDSAFMWRFLRVPIGSSVELTGLSQEDEKFRVSFRPDVIGLYVIGLSIESSSGKSEEVQVIVAVQETKVPYLDDLMIDPKFLWNYLPKFYLSLPGHELLETYWSGLGQLFASDLLAAYEVDARRSIMTILDRRPVLWRHYDPALSLEDQEEVYFYLSDGEAGTGAVAEPKSQIGYGFPVTDRRFMVYSGSPDPLSVGGTISITDLGSFKISRVGTQDYLLSEPTVDYFSPPFSLASGTSPSSSGNLSTGVLPATVLPGDVVYIRDGINEGLHRIETIVPELVTLEHKLDTWPSNEWQIYRLRKFTLGSTESLSGLTQYVSMEKNSILSPQIGSLLVVDGRTSPIFSLKAPLDDAPSSRQSFSLEDQLLVSGKVGLDWRHPHVLYIPGFDFQKQGVFGGDTLVFEAINEDNSARGEIWVTVLGAVRDKLAFELTNEPIEPDEIVQTSSDEWIAACSILKIESAMSYQGDLLVTNKAYEIQQYARNGTFDLDYRNRWIPKQEILQLVGANVRFEPIKIYRNSSVLVDDGLLSVPGLTDWIRRPSVRPNADGTFTSTAYSGKESPSLREPVAIKENLDYVVDGESDAGGYDLCGSSGVPLVSSQMGSFLERQVLPGDSVVIVDTEESFVVADVLSQTELLLESTPTRTISMEEYRIERSREGIFIRFVPGLFTPQKPAPDRLWAEVSYFDNNQAIEDRFGVLVNLKAQDLSDNSTGLSYKSCVTALAYARTKGVTPSTLSLACSAFLGLPFTEFLCRVVEVREDFVKDPVTGKSKYGRITVAKLDNDGQLTGTTKTYLYPSRDPEFPDWFNGLALNPLTAETIKVGDLLNPYTVLSNGIKISDRFTDPLWWEGLAKQYGSGYELLKYHNFMVSANVDVIHPTDLNLLHDVLRSDFRLAYTDVVGPLASKFIYDTISIEDEVYLKLMVKFYDNPGGSYQACLKEESTDHFSNNLIHYDNNPLLTRTIYRSTGETVELLPGVLNGIRIADGGLLTHQPHPDTRMHDVPMVRVRDIVRIHSGPSQGWYLVGQVVDDYTVRVFQLPSNVLYPGSPPIPFLEASDGFICTFHRIQENPMVVGAVTGATGTDTATFESAALYADNVTTDDFLVIVEGASIGTYRIAELIPPSSWPGDLTGQWTSLKVTPDRLFPGDFDHSSAKILRPRLYSREPLLANAVVAVDRHTVVIDVLAAFLAEFVPGDWVQFLDGSGFVVHTAKIVHVSPPYTFITDLIPLAFVGNQPVQIVRTVYGDTGLSWDELLDVIPNDLVLCSISHSDATIDTVMASAEVSVTSADPDISVINEPPLAGEVYIIPGDYLKIPSGPDSLVDIGYGPGVYPICEVQPAKVILAVPLTSNQNGLALTYLRGRTW